MDTFRGIHWGDDFLEEEGCYDHVHHWREVSLWVSQKPRCACPRLVLDQDGLLGMIDNLLGYH
jgi:hypothetical protein